MKIKEFLYVLAMSLTYGAPEKISVNEKDLSVRFIDGNEGDVTDSPNLKNLEPETVVFIDADTKEIVAIIRGHLLLRGCEFTSWCENNVNFDSTLAYEQHYKVADSL